jgi:membrane-bound inhibitor of C-type lysozyme
MAITLKHMLAASTLVLAAAGLCAPASASASETHPKATKVLKEKAKSSKHKKAKKDEPKQDVADNEPEPDVTDTTMAEYSCELNNKVAIYRNPMDDSHIALRWKNHLRRMDKVGTTTGAQRYENTKLGLVWIGIPSKGILLDSKQGRQLANECKDAEQAKPVVAATPGDKNS